MELNAENAVFIKITNQKNSLPIFYEFLAPSLCKASTYKYLAVPTTNKLSWNQHVSNICASLFTSFALLDKT